MTKEQVQVYIVSVRTSRLANFRYSKYSETSSGIFLNKYTVVNLHLLANLGIEIYASLPNLDIEMCTGSPHFDSSKF